MTVLYYNYNFDATAINTRFVFFLACNSNG